VNVKNTGNMRVQTRRPQLTAKVDLPGGQDRLRQMILYVAIRNMQAERFGLTKLNKIIWRADFESFAVRGRPVTGRAYQRLPQGPAPKEMRPLLNEMLREGAITLSETDFGDDIIERRPIAMVGPNLSNFSKDDIEFVEASIRHYWDKTGGETSDDSHGIAWKTRGDKAIMYYELSYLSDEDLSAQKKDEILSKLRTREAMPRRGR
jgi:Antitoxin SocA-like, Panacea domain